MTAKPMHVPGYGIFARNDSDNEGNLTSKVAKMLETTHAGSAKGLVHKAVGKEYLPENQVAITILVNSSGRHQDPSV